MMRKVVTVTLNPALDKTVTIDNLIIGGLNRVKSVRMDAGGKGINAARVLNQFCISVEVTGLIAGKQGQLLLNYLENENIKSQFLNLAGETRINLKIVDEHSRITTEVNETGITVDDSDLLRFQDILGKLLDQASLMILGGSLPYGAKPDVYRIFIEQAKSKGVKTILDADGPALIEGIKALPYAIKPNLHELEMLSGKKMTNQIDILNACKTILNSGIELIVVSIGADGAYVMNKHEIYRTKTFPIEVQSTVGAGDSMVAMLAYTLLNKLPLSEAARWITAAGTITASKPGTQLCTFEEVQHSIDAIQLEKIL